MKDTQVVILGAGYAGILAALRLSHKTNDVNVSITLVNAGDTFIERTRQHQVSAGQRVPAPKIKHMLRGTGVQFVQGTAKALQPDENKIEIETREGRRSLHYDQLVYALGSHFDRTHIAGAQNAFTLDAGDAIKLRDALPKIAGQHGRVLVTGGGLTGIEAATEIAESHPQLHVELVTSGALGEAMSPAGAAHLRNVFNRLKITIIEHTRIARIDEHQVVSVDGMAFPFDVCVNTTGFVAPALAREAGLAVNTIGQIVIDGYMRSVSHPNVYAAGDSAAFEDDAQMPLRMACATAMPMAAHAADNIAAWLHDRVQQPFQFGYALRCISLGRHDALVQFVDPLDQPVDRIITGKAGGAFKEMILRATVFLLKSPKRAALYRRPHSRTAHVPAPASGLSFNPQS
jgi:NADH dehydrogenase FAD-containing subunit